MGRQMNADFWWGNPKGKSDNFGGTPKAYCVMIIKCDKEEYMLIGLIWLRVFSTGEVFRALLCIHGFP
jgi:hypothetical protein